MFRALSWDEARQQCLLQGTDLAEMNNIDEQRAFTQFLNNWRKLNSNIICLFSDITRYIFLFY